jgi:hypothetical protein
MLNLRLPSVDRRICRATGNPSIDKKHPSPEEVMGGDSIAGNLCFSFVASGFSGDSAMSIISVDGEVFEPGGNATTFVCILYLTLC